MDVPRGRAPAPDGLLLVDKPAGMTSHDVVALTRRMAATRKVGHAGTLDPMATGLLVLGIGRATRFLTYLVGADKTYRATVRLGQETLTEDADGEVTTARGCPAPAQWDGGETGFAAALRRAATALTGRIEQVPSAVSAIKVDGVRSYKRVRAGEDIALLARPVTIHALDVDGEARPALAADGTPVVDLDLRVHCSSGTYVRALARDLGAALGCGAHLTALRRTDVGPFTVDDAATLEALAAAADTDSGLPVLPLRRAARSCFPAIDLTQEEAQALRYGQALPAEVLQRAQVPDHPVVASKVLPAEGDTPGVAAGFDPAGELVALLAHKHGHARPVLVVSQP
ncbi:tRNA pseudouridine(55) synthase TruB [Actinomyces sp. MRS3W]|uniref:tRNA pseudouridine(55) synthase TruB n=1 Tax=Actinomyces sp. MRS3W TaxID=2800796 RepID=UPI0028FD254B|nr:tRNA pseudouridine(55) synthase TruB [Actinomyces sp. MRS3W]MDU0347943.1 tRNA pseudouridine(55) synthase TruB [Actinomyces sp. MRS3W]